MRRIVYQLLHLLHISCQFSRLSSCSDDATQEPASLILDQYFSLWCIQNSSIIFLPFFFLETSAPIQNSFIFLPLKSIFRVLMSVLNALHSRVEEFHGGVHLSYKWFVKKYVYLTLDSNMNVLVVLAHRKLHK